jgi:hypothetical protein
VGTQPMGTQNAAYQGAIALIKNPYLYKRSKHINIYYHNIQDLKKQDKINIKYILTKEIIADRMTKLLGHIAFAKFKKILGLVKN